MALAMKATVTTMSSKPCWRSRLTTCSIIGMLAMGSMGLGWFEVSGRSRVPSPPAMMTAFMTVPPSPALGRCFGRTDAEPSASRPAFRASRAVDVEPAAIQARVSPTMP